MSVQTADSNFHFELPSLSYIDAKWEEPNLRTPADTGVPARKSGFSAWLARQVEAVRDYRRNTQAAHELAMLSDYELRDIGLNRSDLGRVFEREFNADLRQRGAD